MTHFDDVYEIAADNYGLVTVAQARQLGITTGEMTRWSSGKRLTRRGHGVYKIVRWIPTPHDPYAEALALVGEGSFLWGESVLSMHGLALVDPQIVTVATPHRVRRTLPPWIKLVPAPQSERPVFYEGILSQPIASAIEVSKGTIMRERLIDAVEQARRQGLISVIDYNKLKGDFL